MKVLDGKKVSLHIREEITKEINKLNIRPKMVDIQIGENAASDIYIAGKEKAANQVGMDFECIRYSADTDEDEIIKKIKELNNDKSVNGIFIQSPVPNGFDEIKLMNTVIPEKDVDGLTYLNAGMLLNNKESMISCTPNGIMQILKFYKIDVESKNVVIVGRSNLVGKPLISLFLMENATVTCCHSKTTDLKHYTLDADILVVAVGKPKLITADMVKDGAVVVDVGINRLESGLCGDVDFENVKSKASYITPVPGGVGAMTVAMLYNNLVETSIKKLKKI